MKIIKLNKYNTDYCEGVLSNKNTTFYFSTSLNHNDFRMDIFHWILVGRGLAIVIKEEKNAKR